MSASVTSPSSQPKSRVLVVDDISQNLQVVGTTLRSEGYQVTPATNGTQALERALSRPPDLILLDLMMPDVDGLEVCRRLKANPITCHIPIIFLTASNEMEHLVRGFEAGAVDYVTKPFNAPELLARVRTHLELKHAREQLRAMNNEKNEFMGIAAHDLRSPLNAVKGYVEMMREEPGLTPEERSSLLDRIHEATTRMVDMVQNLLDANRIERGEFHLRLAPTDLAALASSVLDALRPRASAKQQELTFESASGPVWAMVDQNVAVQVLENLVSNAVKYSPAGKRIFVRIEHEAPSVRLEVQDQGPGLTAEDQQRLFGKFARLSAKPTGGEQATGLGLSIVKRMVEAMNGQVWCESQLGQGATFLVTLPQALPP